MRLFVDIDDTLVLWPKAEAERTALVSGPPVPNHAVLRFIQTLREFHGDKLTVVVWSLGGADYAEKHARPLLKFEHAWDKTPLPVLADDLFLDDDPLPFYRHRTIHTDALGKAV